MFKLSKNDGDEDYVLSSKDAYDLCTFLEEHLLCNPRFSTKNGGNSPPNLCPYYP